jgi:eukaryotic-like serine/threonine-protein kinase
MWARRPATSLGAPLIPTHARGRDASCLVRTNGRRGRGRVLARSSIVRGMGDDDRTITDEPSPPGHPTPTVRQVDVRDDASLVSSDRYVELGLLGVGGMGEVRELHDRGLGRIVARKRMAEDQSRARFLREVRIQAQLEHPAVVPVYHFERQDGRPTFTMKRVQGRTLGKILATHGDGDGDGRFGPRRLLEALAQVALAVDYAHSRGVVHRDLKPANIMLGEWGEVYVLDWGVSRVMQEHPGNLPEREAGRPEVDQTTVVGTPGYMAPEMIRGDDPGSVRTDVYALGCILFHVVAREPLHTGGATERISATLAEHDLSARTAAVALELAPELVAICRRATAPAGERYPTARAFHEALQRYLDGDRDVVLRREMADRLAARASTSLEQVAHGGSRAERRETLRSLSAALALAPDHATALRGLLRLLTDPPREVPAEVRGRLALADAQRTAALARPAATTALALALGIGLFVWMGVRSWPIVVATIASGLLAAASVLHEGHRARRRSAESAPPSGDRRQDLLPLLASGLTLGLLTFFTSPFLVVPAVAIATTMLRILRDHRQPWLVGLVMGGCVLVPWALQTAGVAPASLSFHDGAMTIHPLAVSFTALPTQIFLVGGVVISIPVATRVALAFRRTLKRAELEVELHSWQLRQLVPDVPEAPAPQGPRPAHAGSAAAES